MPRTTHGWPPSCGRGGRAGAMMWVGRLQVARAFSGLVRFGMALVLACLSASVLAAANKVPVVALTAPGNGATFAAPATITLTASASDPDGTVAKVDFYRGTTLIGTRTTSPYTLTWSNVSAGAYSLTAKATDDRGGTKTSTAVSVTVTGAKLVLLAPVSGANIYGGSVAVSGSFTGDSNTTVLVDNGNTTRVATIDGNTFAATIPIYIGSNTLRVVASRRDRTWDQATVTVTGHGNPLLVFTEPATTAFDAPASVDVTVDAMSPAGSISKVDFYRNGAPIGAVTAPPYRQTLSGLAAGSHMLGAVATDALGATGSTSLAITVAAANVPPAVSLTSPVNGAVFFAPASIPMTANATDSDGSVALVEFLRNGAVVGSTNVPPYAVTSSNVPAGSYALTARATDNRSGVTTSSPVNVTVRPPNSAPTVTLTAPSAGATFVAPATIPLGATASDGDGTISTVDFLAGTTLVGTATVAPYSVAWNGVAAGTYSLTARATDNSGAATTSAPVTVTVNANQPPTVALAAPAPGASFRAPATITLAATASDSDGAVDKVDFFAGTTLIGTATAAPYGVTWNGVAAGTHVLTARATDNSGATTISAPVSVTVNANQPPTVNLTRPSDGATAYAPTTISFAATAADPDGSVTRVDFLAGATLVGTATNPPYLFTWTDVAAGNYTLTARATDNDGAVTTSAPVSVAVAGPVFSILSPVDGATIDGGSVTVSGTVTAPANSGVTVNGIVAAIDGAGHFHATGVPLAIGANSLDVTLTTLAGYTTTQAVNVTSTGPGPVQITASPTQGLAPLEVAFTVAQGEGTTITKVELDVNGDGSFDMTLLAEPWTTSATLAGSGTAMVGVRVTDSQGGVYTDTIPIVLIDQATLDQDLRAVWSGMTGALAAGDKASAMLHLDASAQQKYGPVFDALLPNMPQIVASFSALQSVTLSNGLGEYAVNRIINGENRLFFVYFTVNPDGIWRLGAM